MVSKDKKVGRPLKFKSVEELQKKIDAYFEDENNKPYTITDLAVWLDCDRKTLINYEEKEELIDYSQAFLAKGKFRILDNQNNKIFKKENENYMWKEGTVEKRKESIY